MKIKFFYCTFIIFVYFCLVISNFFYFNEKSFYLFASCL